MNFVILIQYPNLDLARIEIYGQIKHVRTGPVQPQ